MKVVYAVGKRFERAEGAGPSRMMHGGTMLTIFLVVKVEGDCIGSPEGGERGDVGKNTTVGEESHMLSPELDGAGFGTSGWHRVFARSQ